MSAPRERSACALTAVVLALAAACGTGFGDADVPSDAGAPPDGAAPVDAAPDHPPVGELCPDGTWVGYCIRAVSCVASCGAAPVQIGCCPCPRGTFDELDCLVDAGDAGEAGDAARD